MNSSASEDKILSVDIGGSRIKATVLDIHGKMLIEYQRINTPSPSDPERVIAAIKVLTKDFIPYQKVSVGFPGYIKQGVIHTAPNLGTETWAGFNLKKRLSEELKSPVRVVNDADLQGLGIANGKGFELVITLGTGFGSALMMDGNLLPHLEVAHHPVSKDRTYDMYIGNKALVEEGVEKWNKRMKKVLAVLKTVFNYDHLYISGGNAKKLSIKLDDNISLSTNLDGIRGGAKLWQSEGHYHI